MASLTRGAIRIRAQRETRKSFGRQKRPNSNLKKSRPSKNGARAGAEGGVCDQGGQHNSVSAGGRATCVRHVTSECRQPSPGHTRAPAFPCVRFRTKSKRSGWRWISRWRTYRRAIFGTTPNATHTQHAFSLSTSVMNSLMCMPAWAGALGGGVSWQEWFGISPPPTQRHPTLNVVLRQPSALASLSHPQSTPFSSARGYRFDIVVIRGRGNKRVVTVACLFDASATRGSTGCSETGG